MRREPSVDGVHHRREADLEAGDATPNDLEVADGEWSLTTQSMRPSHAPSHSAFWLPMSRIGGQHLNSAAESGSESTSNTR